MTRERKIGVRLASAALCLPAAMGFVHSAPLAAQGARVEIVQPPAWIEQGAGQTPLRIGTAIPETMSISTGESGAAALLLSSNAQLGIGPRTRLYLSRGTSPERGARADLGLGQGSIRLLFDDSGPMTGVWAIDAGSLRLEGAAADLWVQRTEERIAVCLMDGAVDVAHPQIGEFALRQPLSCFESPGEAMPTPVLPIGREEAIRRVTASAPQPGLGRMRDGAGWVIQLVSVSDAEKAAQLVRGLHEAGYAAASEISSANGRRIYRLRLEDFETRADAEAIAKTLTGRLGIDRPWVSCPNSPPCQP